MEIFGYIFEFLFRLMNIQFVLFGYQMSFFTVFAWICLSSAVLLFLAKVFSE